MEILESCYCVWFFFFKQKTAYEILAWLEFRRVLFRSNFFGVLLLHLLVALQSSGLAMLCFCSRFSLSTAAILSHKVSSSDKSISSGTTSQKYSLFKKSKSIEKLRSSSSHIFLKVFIALSNVIPWFLFSYIKQNYNQSIRARVISGLFSKIIYM